MSTNSPKNTTPTGIGEVKLKNWTDYLIIIRERWLIALTISLSLSFLFFYHQIQQPKVYAAAAVLIVEPAADQVVNIKEVMNLNTLDEGVMQVHESQLRSSVFNNLVFASLTQKERDALTAPHMGKWGIEPGEATERDAARAIALGLVVKRYERKYQFAIQMRHQDPKVAAFVPNRYVEKYQFYLLERAQNSNNKAIDFLKDEATNTEGLMDEKWEELRNWRELENLISFKEQQEFIQEKRKEVSSVLTTTEHLRFVLETKIKLLNEQLKQSKDPFENPDVQNFDALAKLKEEKDVLLKKKKVLEQRYLAKHPLVLENSKSIELIENYILSNIESLSRKLANELMEVMANEEKINKKLSHLDDEAKKLNVLFVKADRLKFEIESSQESLKTIKERRRDIEITSRIQNLNVKIADRAYPPGGAIEPAIKKVIILSVVMALILFVGIPISLDAMDNKVKNSWDITQFLKVELLAQIGILSKIPKSDRMNIARKGLDHAAVESFRDLYSQIGMHSKIDFPKTVLITSTIPEEGKSMLASNMASIFGRHGHKTLLVDLDLRRPTLHRSFNLSNKCGLIHYLESTDPFPGPLTKDPALGIHEMEPNAHLMCSGGHSRDATEIIVSNEFKALIKALHEEYSLIILDTPPLGVFPDALLLAEMADEIIYLVRHGKPKRTAVRNLLHKIRGTKSDLLGVVVNDLPPKKASYYYGHYGYYNYYTYKSYQKYYTDTNME
jgi:succinoglycan biosynthesis transport protein ExoP